MRKILSIQGSNPREEDYQSKRIENIPIHRIKPNPYQPRKSFSVNGLEELAQSIRQYGVIQPITVRRSTQDGYELIAGERRLRAAKLAGFDYIPAIIMNTYEQDSAIMAMIENLQRENLHYLEEAKGYASLIRDHEFTQEELAIRLGKNQSTIANKLRILKLSDEIKDILIREGLTERHARALLKLPDDESRMQAVKQIIDNKLNVRDTEGVVDYFLQKETEKQNKKCNKMEVDSKKTQKKIFKRTKDIRIFINTIKNAVNLLKNYGMAVQYYQYDKGDKIEIVVTIPKS
ncbi:MAG: nucleoid occlusion protein [Clostridiales bacterium]|nr:nucleoid occlusion protein [Clostridiales bacterium]